MQIQIPTVFERRFADGISAKRTYPAGPLFVVDERRVKHAKRFEG